MSHPVLTEEPLQFGESGRLFGILTLQSAWPLDAAKLPTFVFLNAGVLHRVGPYRLHVRLARALAGMGFSSLRVDLAGIGDSPRRHGLTSEQSVAADFGEILRVLDSRLGQLPLVLAGLCSGASNAIRLTVKEPRVVGMVLLDPICFPDEGFRARAVIGKYTNPARYAAWLKLRLNIPAIPSGERPEDVFSNPATLEEDISFGRLGEDPTREQLRAAFESICGRRGRALSVFTRDALDYYNQEGQLGRVVGVDNYQRFCTELFWPQTEHTYTLERHRHRLVEKVKTWAAGYIRSSATRRDKAGAICIKRDASSA